MVHAVKMPKKKALLLENIDELAIKKLRDSGFDVSAKTYALSEDELIQELKNDYTLLGIRSKTQITAKSISKAKNLLSIGAFCIGVNQIDQDACTKQGIVVFNAPYSNTRSVVELTLGQIFMLLRRATAKHMLLQKGIWDKSSDGCYEVRGKTLGIVGYGNIGSQLSVLAENLGMRVIAYDVAEKLMHGNVRKTSTLDELLIQSDIVTIHVDGRKSNTNLISRREIGLMKRRSYLINTSRGFVVDLVALEEYIQKGHLAGVALDVYPVEPKATGELFLSSLRTYPNVLLTPHIGAGTQEAQRNIGEFVAGRFLDYLKYGDTTLSVNIPNVRLDQPTDKNRTRIIHIHKNVPGIMAALNKVFASSKINILAQALGTNKEIGYSVTEISGKTSDNLISKIEKVKNTIRVMKAGL